MLAHTDGSMTYPNIPMADLAEVEILCTGSEQICQIPLRV